MMQARAAVLRQTGTPMTIETVDVGPVAAGDVLVRIRAASLCHTDLEAIEGALAVQAPGRARARGGWRGCRARCRRHRAGGGRPRRAVVEPALRPLLLLRAGAADSVRAVPRQRTERLSLRWPAATDLRWRADASADVSRGIRRILRGAGAERGARAGSDAVRSRGAAGLRRDDRRRRGDAHRRPALGRGGDGHRLRRRRAVGGAGMPAGRRRHDHRGRSQSRATATGAGAGCDRGLRPRRCRRRWRAR